MKRFITSLVCFGIVAAWATAGGADAKLDGTWVVIASTRDGEKAPEDDLKKTMVTVVMKGGKYAVTAQGKKVEAGTYTTDATKKPATIDVTITAGDEKGRTELGIYKLDGDTLTMAVTPHDSKQRPKDFKPAAKGEVMVFKRVK